MLLSESLESTANRTYLHYWYDDYESSQWRSYDFNAKKREIITEQLARFQTVKQEAFSTSGNVSKKDYEKTLEIFLGKNTQEERQKIFSGKLGRKSASDFLHDVKLSGFEDIGTGSYGAFSKGLKKGTVDLSNITSTTQTFLDRLNKNLDEVFNQLFTGNTWQKYKNDVVQSYVKSKGKTTPTSETGLQILKDFEEEASSKQFVKIVDTTLTDSKGKAYDSAIQSSLKKLAGIAAGMELAQGTSAYQGDSSYFTQVSNLVAGLMTNVAGSGLEVIVKDAEENVCDGVVASELEKLGFEIHSVGNGVINCGTSIIKDPTISQDAQEKTKSAHKSTADVRVSYEVSNGQGYISIDYGINVKNYQVTELASGVKRVDIKLKDGITFMDALEGGSLGFRGSGFYTYLYNLAGGHPETRKNRSGTTGPQLTAKWLELVNLVTVNGLFMALVGANTKYDRSLILMVNGIPYTMDEVLNKALNEADRTKTNFSGKVRYRGLLEQMNYWRSNTTGEGGKGSRGRATHNSKYYDTEKAKFRSQQAIMDIHSSLQEAKLKIYLNFYFS